ncbi:MAG: hypothetical protein H8E37_03730 [Planctomycetes bacterium]|nr:hypothetical protein [Planctomycetota bacterium]
MGGRLPPDSSSRGAIEKRRSAEQLPNSILTATGERERLTTESRKAAEAAAKTETQTEPADENEEPPLTLETIQTSFKTAFANAAREPEDTVSSTVKGALFWRNAIPVQQLLRRRPGNLIDRLATETDNVKMVEELYLSVLSRPPSSDETKLIVDFVATYSDERELAIRDAAWALLTSIEFYVNH